MNEHTIDEWIENYDPDGDPPNLHSEFDDSHRNELLEVFKDFCRHLHTRLRMFGPYGPSTFDVFDTNEKLKNDHIGQEKHTFLREFLLSPAVEVLGYSFIAEPRPAQTESHIWAEDVYPDLRLIPYNWPVGETVPTIIVEHKAFGRFEKAKQDLREDYLSKARTPVYGIATDILTWKTYHVSNDGEIESLDQVPLRRTLQMIRRGVMHEEYNIQNFNKIDQLLSQFERLPGNVNSSV